MLPTTNYFEIAQSLLNEITSVWASEEAMAEVWTSTPMGALIPFDRTAHAGEIVSRLFQRAWNTYWVTTYSFEDAQAPHAVARDILNVAAALPSRTADYNLLSQVMPNLVPVVFIPQTAKALADLGTKHTELEALGVPSPKAVKKAKVDESWPAATKSLFTQVAGLVKTASAFEKFRQPSWRITPFGRTPALTDNASISGLPVVADPYLYVGPLGFQVQPEADPIETAYITWDPTTVLVPSSVLADGSFEFPSLPGGQNTFKSESGGSILNTVMQSRFLATWCWRAWASKRDEEGTPAPGFFVIAKMASVRLTGPKSLLTYIHTKFSAPEGLGTQTPGLEWSWGTRAIREA